MDRMDRILGWGRMLDALKWPAGVLQVFVVWLVGRHHVRPGHTPAGPLSISP